MVFKWVQPLTPHKSSPSTSLNISSMNPVLFFFLRMPPLCLSLRIYILLLPSVLLYPLSVAAMSSFLSFSLLECEKEYHQMNSSCGGCHGEFITVISTHTISYSLTWAPCPATPVQLWEGSWELSYYILYLGGRLAWSWIPGNPPHSSTAVNKSKTLSPSHNILPREETCVHYSSRFEV